MNKHVVNDPRTLALDSLRGLVTSHPDLELDETYRVVKRGSQTSRPISDKVQLVSGGGSGHEPSFAGMVGTGLLDASVCGNVFASPNVGQIRRGVELVSSSTTSESSNKGVLMIIMRYTGDVLQFALTLEHSRSTDPSLPISLIVVGDDVSVTRTQGTIVGRRGLAGTVLVHKLAGAMAERGDDLEAITTRLNGILGNIGTCGVGLGHCSVPGSGGGDGDDEEEQAHLAADHVEIGMGIHNEPGVLTIPLTKASELVPRLLEYITSTSDEERSFVPFKHDGKDEVVLLVNNLGGISEVEMGLIAREAITTLHAQGIRVRRVGTGRYMTSLNLPGFSLTTLLLPREGGTATTLSSDQVIELLDAPAVAPGWVPLYEPRELSECLVHMPEKSSAPKTASRSRHDIPFAQNDSALFSKAVKSACESVIQAEPEITRYDTSTCDSDHVMTPQLIGSFDRTVAGDGDCGTCLKAGAEEILKAFDQGLISQQDVPSAILGLAEAMERVMDGTSGALYSITFNALAAGFHSQDIKSGPTAKNWAIALSHALESLYKYTNARPPSRTLVDPLDAFTSAFAESEGSDLDGAVSRAREAAEKTKDLVAKAGRAAYVGQETLKDRQVPDPGAWGVVKILEGLQQVLSGGK